MLHFCLLNWIITTSAKTYLMLKNVTLPATQMHGCDSANCDHQQNLVAADVSVLLDSAAAEVMPHFEEPKKMWPLPFETAGGSYVYASEYGLYWDPDSMFYYDAQTKVYHNSFTGVYYQCVRPTDSGAAAFQCSCHLFLLMPLRIKYRRRRRRLLTSLH